ncbi:MAG: site-specific integrase [Oscillospiraceae bacterium]|nr:site-specific integrase [Oscillospiraceae bacterium]
MARRGENIYKRKDGRYEGRYIKTYDINGKAVYASVYARNYADIKDKLAKCKSDNPPRLAGSAALLSDWLITWIESEDNIKETTKRLYKSNIKNHIIPKIGKIPLKRLSGDILQSFVSSFKLAPSTVQLIFTVLKSALTRAEDRGFITNIWSKVKLPKRKSSEVTILTPQEQSKLESVLCEKNDIGILICLYMGLRIGELCALKWSDVDFDNGIIHIKGTQSRIDGELKVMPPKSKASCRVIPIPDFLAEKLKTRENYSEFVLSNNGKAVETRAYRRRLKTLLKSAELPDIKFHALRHTFASRALEVGMDYKTLSEILGHASVSITMDLYVHSLDEHKKNQMNKLNRIFNLPSE